MKLNNLLHQHDKKTPVATKSGLPKVRLFSLHKKLICRISLALTGLVMALSFAALPTGSAIAAVKYSGLTLTEKASAYENGLILERCLVDQWLSTNEALIKEGRVAQSPNKASKWTVWDKTIINYHQTLKSDDNVMDCAEYDDALIKGAVKRLKIDPIHFTCAMGGNREDGTSDSNCAKGSGNFGSSFPDGKITRDKLVAYLKDNVGLDIDSPGDAVRYWRSYNIVSNYCVGAGISKAEWDKEGGNNRYNYADPDTGNQVYFLANSSKNEKPKYKNSQQGDMDCRTYWERMDKYHPAYVMYTKTLTDEDKEREDRAREDSQNPIVNTDSPSACRVDGIGWILCPVINAMAGMADATFNLVGQFMKVSPLGFATDNPLYSAWAIMRNIANVAFVIAFLFIIFSQLTGAGISNYGVKKMLPRLVIAAILVNVSYFVCAIAVDISNILGFSVQQVLHDMANNVVGEEDMSKAWTNIATSVLSLGAIGAAAGAVAAAVTSVSIWGMLAGLLPLLIAALFALVVAFLVLLARQAFIIMLIVVSPLAFVAFLLPNTEGLFKKWRSFFVTLLALFPMMALVFGGAVLSSAIMRQGSAAIVDNDILAFFMYLGSVAVLALPFFVTPLLIKLSGGVLNRFAGFVNNPKIGPFDRMKKGAERIQKDALNRGYARKLNEGGKIMGFGARRRARVGRVSSSLDSYAKSAESDYIGKTLQSQYEAADGLSDEEAKKKLTLARQMSAGNLADARVTSQKVVASLESDDLRDAMQPLLRQLASMRPEDKNTHLKSEIAAGGARRSAALNYAASVGDTGFMREQLSSGDTDTVRRAREAINANAGSIIGKAPDLIKGTGAAFGSVKGDDLVQLKKDSATAMISHIKSLKDAATNPNATAKDAEKFKTAIDGLNSAVVDISKSPDLQARFSAEVGSELLRAASASGLGNDLSALAGIQNDGKIR